MKIVRIGLATALLAASAAAAAQSATDARCLLLSNAFANGAKDDNAKKAAEIAGYFYLGRISEHATAAQLKPILERESKSLTDATAGPQMNACVKAIQDKVQLMQSMAPSSPQPAQSTTPPPPGR